MHIRSSVLVGCILAAAVCSAADPTLTNLVMPNARIAFGVQIDRIKSTPIGQAAIAQMYADPKFKAFVESFGFDPLRDISEILVASPAGAEKPPVLALLRGSFDPELLAGLAKTMGGNLTTFEDVPILVSPKNDGAIALLSHEIAVGGTLYTVQAAIVRSKSPEGISPKLAAKVQELSSRYEIWCATAGPLSWGPPSGQANSQIKLKNNPFQSIEQFSGGVRFGPSLDISAELLSRTEKDATELANVLRFFGGLLQANPQTAGTQAALPEITVQKRMVKLSVTVPEQELAKAIQQASMRASQRTEAARVPQPVAVKPPQSTEVTIISSEGTEVRTPPSDEPNVVVLPGPPGKQ